jgi:hypothetical protein
MNDDCGCSARPDGFFADDAPPGFLAALGEIETGEWKTLSRCLRCGQHWSVDAWDKLQHQVVVRIGRRADWQAEADSMALRKQLLLASRGGTTSLTCAWSGCALPSVNGVVYCVDHLWTTGARR